MAEHEIAWCSQCGSIPIVEVQRYSKERDYAWYHDGACGGRVVVYCVDDEEDDS